MSQFKIINLTNGSLSLAAGGTLEPGASKPVDVVTLELQRLEASGYVKIEQLEVDPTAPSDLKPIYSADALAQTFTKADLINLIQTDAEVREALRQAVADDPT